MNFIERPNVVKAFASNAQQGDYLPVQFGTNIVVPKTALIDIANANFEFGLESLEKDLQLKDLNTVLFYNGSLIKYLFEQGVAEFSAYQDYPAGAIVAYNNELYISTKDIKASLKAPTYDPCNPCGCGTSTVCGEVKEPSTENGWCKFVTHCTYDNDLKATHESLEALQGSINALKGVSSLGIIPNERTGTPELTLTLSDGSKEIISMDKFGKTVLNPNKSVTITNPDGTVVDLPKYVVESTLDQNKGFYWNSQSNKWEVDLSDLIQSGSGLEVDRNGNVKVKPTDFLDGSTLSVDPTTGKARLDPDYAKSKITDPIKELKEKVADTANNGAKVFVSNPISGSGRSNDPLGIKLGKDFTLDATGKIILANNAPETFTGNIANHKYNLGFHTFNGHINNSIRDGVIGLPPDWGSNDPYAAMTKSWEDYAPNQAYDFNGYYIASGNELNIWVANNSTTWYISNDEGVNPDGSLKSLTAWTEWQRLDNVGGITNEMVKRLQDQVNALSNEVAGLKQQSAQITSELQITKNKVTTLENKNNETCKVPCKHITANYTVVDTDNTLICINGSPITITLPSNIPQGRMFTIIQTNRNKVTLAGSGNRVIAPRDGSLVLGGQDAVVTVLYEIGGVVRVFGDTE